MPRIAARHRVVRSCAARAAWPPIPRSSGRARARGPRARRSAGTRRSRSRIAAACGSPHVAASVDDRRGRRPAPRARRDRPATSAPTGSRPSAISSAVRCRCLPRRIVLRLKTSHRPSRVVQMSSASVLRKPSTLRYVRDHVVLERLVDRRPHRARGSASPRDRARTPSACSSWMSCCMSVSAHELLERARA